MLAVSVKLRAAGAWLASVNDQLRVDAPENGKAEFPAEIRPSTHCSWRPYGSWDHCSNQAVAASLSFFIGRTLTFTVAGLARSIGGMTTVMPIATSRMV